jgi:hypothetical protein
VPARDPLDAPSPDGTASVEQPEYGPEEVSSVLTPMGQVESLGDFARGLGPRVVKVVLFGSLALLLVAGIVAELR